jgi:hypothetical protein
MFYGTLGKKGITESSRVVCSRLSRCQRLPKRVLCVLWYVDRYAIEGTHGIEREGLSDLVYGRARHTSYPGSRSTAVADLKSYYSLLVGHKALITMV